MTESKLEKFTKTPEYHITMIILMAFDLYFKPFGDTFVFLDMVFIGFNLYPIVEVGMNKLKLYAEQHKK